ncbi:EAL domain-containing protein [Lichenicoccus sp.]|uniref:EAL domain-containing protein n=1 Tax=Lichenicoccus sp. TaxID=2781899 RepID=UPI003D0E2201
MVDCAREPIHAPGHVQPHGVLVATYPGSRRISHVSANIDASLGLAAAAVLGRGIDQLFGAVAVAALDLSLGSETYAPSNVLTLTLPIPRRPRRKIVAHRHAGRLIVELEDAPLVDDHGGSLSQASAIIATLRRAETLEQLCDSAARQIRQLVGFHRVLVYRFDSDGHGTVVAEDRAPGLGSYLQLRFPGSDIPPQARRLSLLQRVRGIPDAGYRPAVLLAAEGAEPADALDMTFCALRGVARVHLDYLRHMGVSATLAISLLRENVLWGMIVCQHLAPFAVAAEMRGLCDVIGQLISVLLLRVSETEELAGRLRRHYTIASLGPDIEAVGGVTEGLRHRSAAVLDLMQATGALIRCGGSTSLIGETPDLETAASMLGALRRRHQEDIVAIDDAGIAGGLAASCPAIASGILLMPMTDSPEDAIAWFRPERVRSVQWGGDPRDPATRDPHEAPLRDPHEAPLRDPHEAPLRDDGTTGPLSPAASFVIWREQVMGRSDPWTAIDLQAARDLRRTVTGALLRQAETRLARLSAYDPLTGLANRRTIEAHLERWRVEALHPVAALLSVDIDRFKTINDTFGHAGGDEILIQTAARLRHAAPAGSIVGRLGGDEFVILWEGAGPQEAERLALALVQELAQPIVLQGQGRHVNTSIGVASAAAAGPDVLMRQADAAMYAAKRAGGGRPVMFQAALHAAVLTNMQTEQDLFRAVASNELEIHYQPQVTLPDRQVCGFEALLRWRHPDRGWVSPDEFIPRAEEAGLIARIGARVLAEAIRQIGVWRRLRPGLTISINVSARQLTEGALTTLLAAILAAEDVPGCAICIEVTESALMHEASVRELQLLRDLGARVAVDDFGTGYSSLSYLQSLPVDTVKIDRSFVVPLGSSARADRFFCAIVALAQTIELRTIAEGCETQAQWQVIAEAGCDAVQGWLVAHAMDAATIGVQLERAQGWAARPASEPRA